MSRRRLIGTVKVYASCDERAGVITYEEVWPIKLFNEVKGKRPGQGGRPPLHPGGPGGSMKLRIPTLREMCADLGGQRSTAKLCRVNERTMRRWVKADLAPYAAFVLIQSLWVARPK